MHNSRIRLLLLNLQQALRHLNKHKARTAITVGILSLALAGFSISSAALWHSTHQERHMKHYTNLYQVSSFHDFKSMYNYWIWDSISCFIRDHCPAKAQVALMLSTYGKMGEGPSIKTWATDSVFFHVINPEFAHGAPFRSEAEAVISDSLAMQLFGTEEAVGRTLELNRSNDKNDLTKYRISGILRSHRGSHFEDRYDILIPMEMNPGGSSDFRYSPNSYMITISTPDPAIVEPVLKQAEELLANTQFLSRGQKLDLIPFRLVHLLHHYRTIWEAAFYPIVFIILSIMLLISSIFSFMSLLNTAAEARWTEFRLRISLGEGWDALYRLQAEVLLIFCATGILGMVLAELGYHFCQPQIEAERTEVNICLLLTLGVLLAVSLLLCAIPTILQYRRHQRNIQGQIQGKISSLNFPLAIVQMGVSLLLMWLVWQGGRQIRYISRDGLGMNVERVYTFTFPDGCTQELKKQINSAATAQEIAKVSPAIEHCVYTTAMFNSRVSEVKYLPKAENFCTLISLDDSVCSFFQLKPQPFSPSAASIHLGEDEVWVNSTLAKKLNISAENPDLEISNYRNNLNTIMKVKGTLDFCTRNLRVEPAPLIILPGNTHTSSPCIYFRTRKGMEQEAIKAVEQYFLQQGITPGNEVKIQSMENQILAEYREEQYYLKLYSVLTVLGFGIAVFGLLVLVDADLQRQRRSLAIRRIFGASYLTCLTHTLRTYLFITLGGAAIALPAGQYLLGLWLETYTGRITPGSWEFGILVLTMGLVVSTLVAIKVKAYFRENPSEIINN